MYIYQLQVLPDDLDTPPLEVNWKFYSDTDVPLCATIDTRPGGSTFLPKSSSFGVLAPGTPPIANFVPHSHNHRPVSGPPPTSTLMLPAPPLVGLSTPVQQPQPPAQVLAYRQMRASDRFNPYTLSGIPLVVRLAIKVRIESSMYRQIDWGRVTPARWLCLYAHWRCAGHSMVRHTKFCSHLI